MKKYLWVIVVVILIVICALGVFLFNKGKVEDVTTNAEEFKTEIRTISEKISGENNVGLLDINYEYIEFVTDNEYLKSLNNEIKNRAEERVNNFKDYKSDAENVIGTDLGTQLPYVYDNKTRISYNEGNILVIEDAYNEDAGGPHPNHGVDYYNYDIAQEKELTINDIFEGKTDSEIASIIMEKVRSHYAEHEEIESFFEMLPLEENIKYVKFAIEKDDILIDLQYFVPYAFGECAVKIEK